MEQNLLLLLLMLEPVSLNPSVELKQFSVFYPECMQH